MHSKRVHSRAPVLRLRHVLSLLALCSYRTKMAAGKMRWGDADFEGGEAEAPAPYETEPDENGVKTIVSYDTKDDGTKVKVSAAGMHGTTRCPFVFV